MRGEFHKLIPPLRRSSLHSLPQPQKVSAPSKWLLMKPYCTIYYIAIQDKLDMINLCGRLLLKAQEQSQ